jgi:DNA-directed RNA polymerase sigma subunit (sigma70/sigma32)
MNYAKFLQDNRKRAGTIVALRDVQKWTFSAIGKRFEITAQRAQQIYKTAKKLLERAAK